MEEEGDDGPPLDSHGCSDVDDMQSWHARVVQATQVLATHFCKVRVNQCVSCLVMQRCKMGQGEVRDETRNVVDSGHV